MDIRIIFKETGTIDQAKLADLFTGKVAVCLILTRFLTFA